MAVLDFDAHTLDYLHVTDGYEDDNGDYVQGSEEWVENYCKCDIVPAGKANVITIPDGSAKNYSYTIYNLMTEQKMKGVAVIFVGEDLDVLLELCDRILVLCGGKVSGIVDARTATKEEIGLMMTRVGGGKEEAVHA